MYTVREASEQLGVTPQRVHALIRDYALEVTKVAEGRLFLIPQSELDKIPLERPNGVRHDREKKPEKKSKKRST